jgi:ferritin
MVSSYVFVSSIIIGFFSPLIFGGELQQIYEVQVQKEFLASNVYLTFAHRLATRGVYHGFANFFFESAEEEREHGKKLIDFYNVRNRELTFKEISIDDEIATMTDLTKMIQKADLLEKDVYANLIKVRQAAYNETDYPTVHFIEKQMLEEQTTALKYMEDLVQRIARNSNNPTIVLQMMDQDLRAKQVKKP